MSVVGYAGGGSITWVTEAVTFTLPALRRYAQAVTHLLELLEKEMRVAMTLTSVARLKRLPNTP